MATRNPVSVFPVPVGRGDQHVSPRGDQGQAARWGSVGPSGKRPRNQPGDGRVERAQDRVGRQTGQVGRPLPGSGGLRRRARSGHVAFWRRGPDVGPWVGVLGPTGRQGGGHGSSQA